MECAEADFEFSPLDYEHLGAAQDFQKLKTGGWRYAASMLFTKFKLKPSAFV